MALTKLVADRKYPFGFDFVCLSFPKFLLSLVGDFLCHFFLTLVNSKIIELSAIKLQKLRVNYQQLQQQNLQLAQTNSQMLAVMSCTNQFFNHI